MMYRKFFAWVAVLGIVTGAGFAQQRHISIDDLRLEPEFTEAGDKIIGFHLFVRKKDGIESVLLTETTKDPAGIEANYAYRAPEWNPVNGNEIRMLNGERLVSPSARYSIIDSTPEADAQFGSAFHLYIPSTMVYGYPWTRNGTVKITRGTFINIRTFGAQYGDYSGGFDDNPFMFDLGKPVLPEKMPATEPAPVPEVLPEPEPVVLTDKYNPMAAASFDSLAAVTGGQMRYAGSAETVSADILRCLEDLDSSRPADIVFAIDTTGSMKDDIQQIRAQLLPQLAAFTTQFPSIRFGLLLYRDYVDNYRYNGLPVKYFPFTEDLSVFEKNLNSFTIYGTEGGDVPEAVYEALFAAMDFYRWQPACQRKVILIGDAEPHPVPRGTKKYTRELVEQTALARDIVIDTIITPDGQSSATRRY